MDAMTIQDNKLMTVAEVKALIEDGRQLVLSGNESVLEQLPKGNWIGGTIPYFYNKDQGGGMDKEHIFVTDFSDTAVNFKVATYDQSNLNTVCTSGFENGFHFMILPALKDIHLQYALEAPTFPNLYTNPLIGLIAGADLEEFAAGKPSRTYNGSLGESYENSAVVLHVEVPENKVARLEIVNVFEPSDEVTIEVMEDGFEYDEVMINGEKQSLYDYITENNIDTSYPIVSDYSGATVNISFQRMDEENKKVILYAPLFKGRQYTLSKKFESYTDTFIPKAKAQMAQEKNMIYNCNCILNYLYGELDKNTIGFSGPTTFGEIAYNMLNQTFTYLALDDKA